MLIISDLDRVAYRKIKESNNYVALKKLQSIIPDYFDYYRFYQLYTAIRKSDVTTIDYYGFETNFKDFLRFHDINFVF